jgi:hypothetical protein
LHRYAGGRGILYDQLQLFSTLGRNDVLTYYYHL